MVPKKKKPPIKENHQMTQSSVCGPPMLKRKPKLFFSTSRISKNIIKNKNKLHTPHVLFTCPIRPPPSTWFCGCPGAPNSFACDTNWYLSQSVFVFKLVCLNLQLSLHNTANLVFFFLFFFSFIFYVVTIQKFPTGLEFRVCRITSMWNVTFIH